MAELKSTKMYDTMLDYLAAGRRRWCWGECDCIGLLVRLLEAGGRGSFDRADYIDPGLGYRESVEWLASLPDPFDPYRALIERDAKMDLAPDWDVAVVSTYKPIPLFGGREMYPTDTVPGLIFKPTNMHPVVFHRRGYAHVPIYKDRIARIFQYRIFDE